MTIPSLFLLAVDETIKIQAKDIGLPTATKTVGDALTVTISIIIWLVGLLSVVFIIVGGLKIVASNGDPARYKSGRDTVQYAVAGIVVAILALSIVTFITSSVK